MPGARLKDIANSLGCSIGVVSHVLNHSEGNISCSEVLRDRILRKAVELGYMGHWSSRTSHARRTNTLGVYVPASSPFFRNAYEGQLLAGISEVCRERGYDLLLISIPGSVGAEECATKLVARRIDGLVLLHIPESADWLQPLADLKANCAAVNYFGSVLIPSVNFDDRAATFLAVGEMVRMGHRRLGYLGALRIDAGYSTQRRLDGFLGGLAESHLRPDPHWIFEARYTGGPSPDWRRLSPRDLAQWLAARFVATRPDLRPTAFVCHSDAVAALFLAELHRVGVRCPEDVSIVGLDDAPISRSLLPSLSSLFRTWAPVRRAMFWTHLKSACPKPVRHRRAFLLSRLWKRRFVSEAGGGGEALPCRRFWRRKPMPARPRHRSRRCRNGKRAASCFCTPSRNSFCGIRPFRPTTHSPFHSSPFSTVPT